MVACVQCTPLPMNRNAIVWGDDYIKRYIFAYNNNMLKQPFITYFACENSHRLINCIEHGT